MSGYTIRALTDVPGIFEGQCPEQMRFLADVHFVGPGAPRGRKPTTSAAWVHVVGSRSPRCRRPTFCTAPGAGAAARRADPSTGSVLL